MVQSIIAFLFTVQGEVEQIVFMKPKALSESDHG